MSETVPKPSPAASEPAQTRPKPPIGKDVKPSPICPHCGSAEQICAYSERGYLLCVGCNLRFPAPAVDQAAGKAETICPKCGAPCYEPSHVCLACGYAGEVTVGHSPAVDQAAGKGAPDDRCPKCGKVARNALDRPGFFCPPCGFYFTTAAVDQAATPPTLISCPNCGAKRPFDGPRKYYCDCKAVFLLSEDRQAVLLNTPPAPTPTVDQAAGKPSAIPLWEPKALWVGCPACGYLIRWTGEKEQTCPSCQAVYAIKLPSPTVDQAAGKMTEATGQELCFLLQTVYLIVLVFGVGEHASEQISALGEALRSMAKQLDIP